MARIAADVTVLPDAWSRGEALLVRLDHPPEAPQRLAVEQDPGAVPPREPLSRL